MTKKEFEKETYLAPKWGLRVVCVERHILEGSGDDEESNVPGDENYNDQGDF